MKRKTLFMIVTFMLAMIVAAGIGIAMRNEGNNQKNALSEESEISPYDAAEEKVEAMMKFTKGIAPSDILTNDDTEENYLGLSFSGLSDSVTNQKILDLLDEYDRKATFFVPSVAAVECADDIADMTRQGHAIGNNTLKATVHMEEMSTEELVNDFCVSNKVIKSLSGEADPLLLCNATEYTEDVLKAAHASGNSKVIYSTHFLNYQSFTSYHQVLSYINKLPKGTILTIKLSGVLNEIEMEDKEVDEDPAKDMQATIDSQQQAFLEQTEEERITQIVEWICMALEESNYQTKQIKDFAVNNAIDTSTVYDVTYADEKNEKRVYSKITTGAPYVSLQLRGISDEKRLQQVLTILRQHEATATFYITTKEAEKYSQNVRSILEAGSSIANGGADGRNLTGSTEMQVRQGIQSCNAILNTEYQVKTDFFMPADGKYDSTVLKAAAQENMTLVTYSRCPIIKDGKTIETTMKNFADSLTKGSLIYVNLVSYDKSPEVIEQILSGIEEKEYQTASIEELFQNKTSDDELLLASIEVPSVLSKKEIAELKKKNEGKEAYLTKQVYTIEQALSFTFSGISRQEALDNMLVSMNAMGAKGTFFVTYAEMEAFPDRVKKILDYGNEIGIAIIPGDETTFASSCNEIAAAQNYMKDYFDKTPKLVMNTMSRTDQETVLADMKEAIRAMECRMIGYSVSIVQSSLQGIASADSYYTNLTKSNFSIQMGQIIYTRLDYLSSSQILGKVLQKLKTNKIDPIAYYDEQLGENMWAYHIKTLSSVLYNTADGGTKLYSLNNGSGASEQISADKIDLSNNTALMNSIYNGYIGNRDIDAYNVLPGFSDAEIRNLDTTGKIRGNTGDNYVFLSFDDWGTDMMINHLLYVLDKYQIKATFFVRSNYVSANPNLMRAIAARGHEIGSHTSTHFKLANEEERNEQNQILYSSLSQEDAIALREDVVKSYKDLYKIIGNYAPNGYPALVPIFRPPTLAVSKIGLKQIFEAGFQFSISGDFSTKDYTYHIADGDVDKFADELQNGYMDWDGKREIESHSIVVMHMLDTSEVTPQAIEKWMENGAKSNFNFDQPMYQYITTH